jgi:hypothetical protein
LAVTTVNTGNFTLNGGDSVGDLGVVVADANGPRDRSERTPDRADLTDGRSESTGNGKGNRRGTRGVVAADANGPRGRSESTPARADLTNGRKESTGNGKGNRRGAGDGRWYASGSSAGEGNQRGSDQSRSKGVHFCKDRGGVWRDSGMFEAKGQKMTRSR